MENKILIIGQPLNSKSGGGITLKNLLYKYPSNRIAIASSYRSIISSNTDLCNNLYILGTEEVKFRFPLILLAKKYKSGIYNKFSSKIIDIPLSGNNLTIVKLKRIFFELMHKFGVYHTQSKMVLSNKFLNWFDEFSPTVVYTQLSTYDLIIFTSELLKRRTFKLVIHIMDDWPMTIVKPGLFNKYWVKRIDTDFRQLLSKCNKLLTISEAMSEEYFLRYNLKSKVFHNPIDLRNIKVKKDLSTQKKKKILYTGRIGTANINSLIKLDQAINCTNMNIELHIYTPDYLMCRRILKNNSQKTIIHMPILYEDVLNLYAKFDLLILPLDNDIRGIKFSKFSMPTKFSEYMASGCPILIYANNQSAIAKLSDKYLLTFMCFSDKIDNLKKSILMALSDTEKRKFFSANSRKYSLENCEIGVVSKQFKKQIFYDKEV